MLIFLTQVFLAQIASRVLPSFALGKIFVDDVTSDKVKEFIKGTGQQDFYRWFLHGSFKPIHLLDLWMLLEYTVHKVWGGMHNFRLEFIWVDAPGIVNNGSRNSPVLSMLIAYACLKDYRNCYSKTADAPCIAYCANFFVTIHLRFQFRYLGFLNKFKKHSCIFWVKVRVIF